jgi:hypothetical protein
MQLSVTECPGCGHAREAHKDASCFRLVEKVTPGGETHLTQCGRCGWSPVMIDKTRGWAHESSGVTEAGETFEVEAETLESALMEVSRIMGLR